MVLTASVLCPCIMFTDYSHILTFAIHVSCICVHFHFEDIFSTCDVSVVIISYHSFPTINPLRKDINVEDEMLICI